MTSVRGLHVIHHGSGHGSHHRGPLRDRRAVAAAALLTGAGLLATAAPAGASAAPATAPSVSRPLVNRPLVNRPLVKEPVAVGYGGAVSTVDSRRLHGRVQILRAGRQRRRRRRRRGRRPRRHRAVLVRASAAAATSSTTTPRTHRVSTVDGRETAPRGLRPNTFVDPATGLPYPFADGRRGQRALRRRPGNARHVADASPGGSAPARSAEAPAARDPDRRARLRRRRDVPRPGRATNAARFARFSSTSALYLPGGAAARGRQHASATPTSPRTYRLLARRGLDTFYTGPLAPRDRRDRTAAAARSRRRTRRCRPACITADDIARLPRDPARAHEGRLPRAATSTAWPPSSSGGTTVGEALNILENVRLGRLDRAQALHYYLEASRRAYADRNRYIGDPAYLGAAGRAAMRQLLTQGFADERFCTIDPRHGLARPGAAGHARRPLPPHLLHDHAPPAGRAATTRACRRRTW